MIDDIVVLDNLNFQRNFSYPSSSTITSSSSSSLSSSSSTEEEIEYYSKKWDGIRKNFVLYGNVLHIENRDFILKTMWFVQVIIGHVEILNTGQIIIIDVHIISENFKYIQTNVNKYSKHEANESIKISTAKEDKIDVKKLRLEQTTKYHDTCNMKNNNNVTQMEAIMFLMQLKSFWQDEQLEGKVLIQAFMETIPTPCNLSDGYLSFSKNKIYKHKTFNTVDLFLCINEFYKCILKSVEYKIKKPTASTSLMLTSSSPIYSFSLPILQFPITYNYDWQTIISKCDRKMVAKCIIQSLKFAKNVLFRDGFSNWILRHDDSNLDNLLNVINKRSHVINLLVEFKVERDREMLTFVKVRNDKFAANSLNLFQTM